MTSGDNAERAGEERAFADPSGEERAFADPSGEERAFADPSGEGPAEGADDGEDTAVDPVPAACAEEPRPRRRKAGVRYRPV